MLDFVVFFAKGFEFNMFDSALQLWLKNQSSKAKQQGMVTEGKRMKYKTDICSCLQNFTESLPENIRIVHQRINLNGNKSLMHSIVIEESDVIFNITVNKLITYLEHKRKTRADKNKYTSYISIGTCGVVNHSNAKLNEIFFISKALKFDRGSIYSCDGGKFAFRTRHDKHDLETIEVVSEINQPSRPLICSNFLYEAANFDIPCCNYSNEHLVDMETYDFLRICRMNNVTDFCTYKIVSDIPVPSAYNEPENKLRILKLIKDRSITTRLFNHNEILRLEELTTENFLEICETVPDTFYMVKKLFRKHLLTFKLDFIERFIEYNIALDRKYQ